MATAELTFCDGFAERITRAWVTPPFDIDDNRLVKENILRVETVFATSIDKVVKKIEPLIAVNSIVRTFVTERGAAANQHKHDDHLVNVYRLQSKACVLLFLCRLRKRVITRGVLPSTEHWRLDYVEVGIPRHAVKMDEMKALASFHTSRSAIEYFECIKFAKRRTDKIKLD